ncbi:plastocyanin/azurin family copper-binding protein [Pontibacter ruber]|uniref:Plastocyanin/azurin family copper-binding protein n=1 Tax=Pontibacter ruber TaxID=1343895 RepID=A0ABW5CS46_9BACT|nr:plastocyanin/azurin family copper-binding protein [Pontibacter ruber]
MTSIIHLLFLGQLLLGIAFTPVARVQPRVHVIEIRQMKFNPATLTVGKGDTLVFINKDLVTHNATEITGKSWKSPDLASGDSCRMAISRSAKYYCSLHPVMKGEIIVQ